jgi:hypothetical protein
VTTIPRADEKRYAWEETTLGNAQGGTAGHQTSIVLGDTEKSSADGPGNHDARDPEGRAEALHGHVGGNLGGDIERKEDGETVIVLKSLLAEVEVVLQSVEASVRLVSKGMPIFN